MTTPEQYEPSRPYTFDDTVHTSMGQWRTTSGKKCQLQNRPREVNAGALAAMNAELYRLANPPPPPTRWFLLCRWLQRKRNRLTWRLSYARDQWRSFRFGLGHTIGSWIAGEDLR